MTAPRPSSAPTSAANAAWARTCFIPEALASAHHYGFTLRLCKAYRPQTKGKVESDVPYVRERLLRAHSFGSYEHANRAWASWNEDIARRRVHGTHGEVVAVRAERDRAALGPLPPTPYLVVERTTRVVARDGLFSFEGRRYAVPDARPGERVELVLGAEEIEIYSTVDGRRLARHQRGRPAKVLPDPVERVGVAGAGARRAPGAGGASPAAVGLPAADRWLS